MQQITGLTNLNEWSQIKLEMARLRYESAIETLETELFRRTSFLHTSAKRK